jgi:hypothetical protein
LRELQIDQFELQTAIAYVLILCDAIGDVDVGSGPKFQMPTSQSPVCLASSMTPAQDVPGCLTHGFRHLKLDVFLFEDANWAGDSYMARYENRFCVSISKWAALLKPLPERGCDFAK